MKALDRYIGQTVLLAMALVLLVLAGLDFVFTSFEELTDVNETYRIPDALLYVLLTFPGRLYELLPMTALIGALIGLGHLASANELVVMQAAGIKVGRIVWAVMKPVFLIMTFGLAIAQYIGPPLELRAEVSKAMSRGEGMLLAESGHWQRNGNDYFHFNAVEREGVMHGLSIYRYDDNQRLLASIQAATARYQSQAGRNFWQLEDAYVVNFSQGDDGLLATARNFERYEWDAGGLSPELLQLLILDSGRMAISDLYQYANRFVAQGLDARPYLLAFWEKVLQPLTAIALVLVAISFIFGPLREATMGSRVFTAICFGLLFIVLQRVFNTVSLVFLLPPFLAVLIPVVLTAMIGLILLRRAV